MDCLRVVVRRAWNAYASIVVGLLLVPVVVELLRPWFRGVPLTAYSTSLVTALTAMVILVHELLHFLAARLLGVTGLRLVILPRLSAIAMDYYRMSMRQYAVVAAAPQLLTLLLLCLAYGFGPGTAEGAALALASAVNLGGGIMDLLLIIYHVVVHPRARWLMLLYDEKGRIAGGVVEEPDRLTVYLF